MFIHIGNKNIVSDKQCIGFFNIETLKMSEINEWLYSELPGSDKTVVLKNDNSVITSKVSPFTVTKRTEINKDFIWRKKHE